MPTDDKAETHQHKAACEKPTNNMEWKNEEESLAFLFTYRIKTDEAKANPITIQ